VVDVVIDIWDAASSGITGRGSMRVVVSNMEFQDESSVDSSSRVQ